MRDAVDLAQLHPEGGAEGGRDVLQRHGGLAVPGLDAGPVHDEEAAIVVVPGAPVLVRRHEGADQRRPHPLHRSAAVPLHEEVGERVVLRALEDVVSGDHADDGGPTRVDVDDVEQRLAEGLGERRHLVGSHPPVCLSSDQVEADGADGGVVGHLVPAALGARPRLDRHRGRGGVDPAPQGGGRRALEVRPKRGRHAAEGLPGEPRAPARSAWASSATSILRSASSIR